MPPTSDHAASRAAEYARVQNVVATFTIGCAVNLVPLAVGMGGRAAPLIFPAMVSRSIDTDTASSVFATGRAVEVGCKSEAHALLAAHMLCYQIWKLLGIICSVHNFTVCNVVCRVELPYSMPVHKSVAEEPLPATGGINMTMLFSDAKCSPATAPKFGFKYEPNKFPGLKWKVELPGFPGEYVTFAWFVSGRGVATGLTSPSRVVQCNEFIASMDWYERGSEYREMTPAELAFDANNALVKSKRAPSKKKRKRDHALAQQAAVADATAAAAAAATAAMPVQQEIHAHGKRVCVA